MSILKFENKIELELNRTRNMLKRSKDVCDFRDKISRAYYACYHGMIAAIWCEKNFDDSCLDTAHTRVAKEYKELYTRTKGNNISAERDVFKSVRMWKNLRASADYDIFTKDFDTSIEQTNIALEAMYKFAEQHIVYLTKKLESSR